MRGRMAYMDAPGELSIREYDVPEEIEPEAVLLEVIQSNVCGSEIHIFSGGHPAIKTGGMGHEMVGRISRLGANVTTDHAGQPVAVGDRVVPVYLVTCGRCRACGAGLAIHCENKFKYWGRQEDPPISTAPPSPPITTSTPTNSSSGCPRGSPTARRRRPTARSPRCSTGSRRSARGRARRW